MTPRLIAIVPAAGLSRRMGQPKLLLDLAGQTVIARVVQALRAAAIERCLVVVRPDDVELAREVVATGGEVVQPPTNPAEMRESVEYALREVTRQSHSTGRPCDGWVLIPADHPTLNSELVRDLIVVWSENPSRIAVPTCNGRRGHPTIFPWSLTEEVYQLPSDQGLNSLLRSNPDRVLEMTVTDARILEDLDTPEDWQRMRMEWE